MYCIFRELELCIITNFPVICMVSGLYVFVFSPDFSLNLMSVSRVRDISFPGDQRLLLSGWETFHLSFSICSDVCEGAVGGTCKGSCRHSVMTCCHHSVIQLLHKFCEHQIPLINIFFYLKYLECCPELKMA